jgi:6,7-dimethyl-8-ribityllumazine synthase
LKNNRFDFTSKFYEFNQELKMESIKGAAKQTKLDGSGLHVVVIRTGWNETVVDALEKGCIEQLEQAGVNKIKKVTVPGAYELPFACKCLIKADPSIDAVIAIGCLIKGSTMHFEYICEAVSHGLMQVGLETNVPVIFGVLTCLTEEQALQRAGLKPGLHNHGPEWGAAAITMANLKKGKV